MGKYVVAVDVGTGSARSGIFDQAGRSLARSERPIDMLRANAVFAEYSSGNIWAAVCETVRDTVQQAGVDLNDIEAIGFDATCSLVVLDKAGKPLSVSTNASHQWDTISWLDHRAELEAQELSAGAHEALRHMGGIMSPEMQIPKILWLKRHHPETWENCGLIFDLADFLTWKACGNLVRSNCTLTAKWTYLSHKADGWDRAFLADASLSDLPERAGIPNGSGAVGAAAGSLTQMAATELGLNPGTIVAFGMVDAFAGALSVLGAGPDIGRAALIGGTSTCVMRLSDKPEYLPSFWGPFYGAVLPGTWATEGGQSATGALLDHLILIHGSGLQPTPANHHDILLRIAALIETEGPAFAGNLHVLPDFHGNRSPLGESAALGVLHGMSLDSSYDGLCRLYWRCLVAIGLGIRQIVEAMEKNGPALFELHLGGGHARSQFLAQLYADATGKNIVLSSAEEAMLLGTAMVAATAAGWHSDLVSSCKALKKQEKIVKPNATVTCQMDRDYTIFLTMQEHRRQINELQKAGPSLQNPARL